MKKISILLSLLLIISCSDTKKNSNNLPGRLGPLLLINGICNIDVEPIPILNTEYTPSQFSYGMMNWITKNALKKEFITKEQYQKWLEQKIL